MISTLAQFQMTYIKRTLEQKQRVFASTGMGNFYQKLFNTITHTPSISFPS